MNAYILSHNGLGDNITMIGAVNFLTQYYENVYLLCKDNNAKNVATFFQDKSIHIMPFDGKNEFYWTTRILEEASENTSNDIFIAGFVHKNRLKLQRVTNQKFLQYKPDDKHYIVKWAHIRDFYHDIGLDLSVYYEYFHILSPSIPSIPSIHDPIEKHNIVFAHTKASDNEIQIPNAISKYINDENTIIICANKNVYPNGHSKYELANHYVNIPIVNYIDIIKRATEIHIVDSCFSCIVYPLQQTNRLSATTVTIYDRESIKPQPQPKPKTRMRMYFV